MLSDLHLCVIGYSYYHIITLYLLIISTIFIGVSGPEDWTLVEPFKGPDMKYKSDETHWRVAMAKMTSQLSGNGLLHKEIESMLQTLFSMSPWWSSLTLFPG